MYLLPYITFCASVTLATWIQPTGWLDRLVQYHKEKFLSEVNEVAPVQIKATIALKEPGYVDSTDWDFDSVMRLLGLIRQSEHAKPARQALRRMLQPTRRFMSMAESLKHFPRLVKDPKFKNDIYYDIDSDEMYIEEADNTTSSSVLDDDAIIIISNPVESRLPSSQISVGLLKQILENRAKAARIMPSTTHWIAKRPTKSKQSTTVLDQNEKVDDTTQNEEVTEPEQVEKLAATKKKRLSYVHPKTDQVDDHSPTEPSTVKDPETTQTNGPTDSASEPSTVEDLETTPSDGQNDIVSEPSTVEDPETTQTEGQTDLVTEPTQKVEESTTTPKFPKRPRGNDLPNMAVRHKPRL